MDLTLDLAISDSPDFHRELETAETDIENLRIWLEAVVKHLKSMLEHLEGSNNVGKRLGAMMIQSESLGHGTKIFQHLKYFSEVVVGFSNYYEQVLREVGAELVSPLNRYMLNDIKSLRETRKTFERVQEKYETSVQKFSLIPKTRDPLNVRDDEFQLFHARKLYMNASLDYVLSLNRVRYSVDDFLLERLTKSARMLLNHQKEIGEMFLVFEPVLCRLEEDLQTSRAVNLEIISDMELSRHALEEDAIYKIMPDINSGFDRQGDKNEGVEKAGYLFKRKRPGSSGWERVFGEIRRGYFSYILDEHRKSKGGSDGMEKPHSISVLLIQVKIEESSDRRWVFQITSTDKTLHFQTETEREMHDWIQVIENSKNCELDKKTLEVEQSANQKAPASEDHLERIMMDQVFPFSAEMLCQNLFGDLRRGQGKLLPEIWEARKLRDIRVRYPETNDMVDFSLYQKGSYKILPGIGFDVPSRAITSYMVPISYPFLRHREAYCEEKMVLADSKKLGMYILDIVARVPSLPYGDTFETRTRYYFSSIDASHCRLVVSTSVVFYKSPWLKSIIKGTVYREIANYIALLDGILKAHQSQALTKLHLPRPLSKRVPRLVSLCKRAWIHLQDHFLLILLLLSLTANLVFINQTNYSVRTGYTFGNLFSPELAEINYTRDSRDLDHYYANLQEYLEQLRQRALANYNYSTAMLDLVSRSRYANQLSIELVECHSRQELDGLDCQHIQNKIDRLID